MTRAVIAALAALLSMASLATADVAPTPTAKDLLLRAADEAEAAAAQRWAFTIDYVDKREGAEKAYRLRFDPRRADEEKWTLLAPAEADLNKDEKKRLKNFRKSTQADDALVYDRMRSSIVEAALVAETGTEAVFAAKIRDKDTPKAVMEAVDMTIRLDKQTGHVAAIELEAKKPFKPAPIAKVRTFRQVSRYARVRDGWPPLLVSAESRSSGDALGKAFSAESKTTYSDFEAVSVP